MAARQGVCVLAILASLSDLLRRSLAFPARDDRIIHCPEMLVSIDVQAER